MGTNKETTTERKYIPGASARARRIESLLEDVLTRADGSLDFDISTEITPQQRAYLAQIQELTGDVARSQMRAGLQEAQGQVEAGLLDRGLQGSSIEAVQQAIQGRDFTRQMNEFLMRTQAQTAEQMVNTGFANAQVRLNQNQQLLSTLLGGSQTLLARDLQERMAQGTSTTKTRTKKSAFGQMMQLGQLGASFLVPGAGPVLAGTQLASSAMSGGMGGLPAAPGTPGGWQAPPVDPYILRFGR